jgi:hypothetical protein
MGRYISMLDIICVYSRDAFLAVNNDLTDAPYPFTQQLLDGQWSN